jgi:hypothetical protein
VIEAPAVSEISRVSIEHLRTAAANKAIVALREAAIGFVRLVPGSNVRISAAGVPHKRRIAAESAASARR